MSIKIDIVDQIKYCCVNKVSGALFVKLENDKLLQLFFLDGELYYVKYQNLSGVQALKEISELSAVKSQFHKDASVSKKDELPPTVILIQAMNSGELFGNKNSDGSDDTSIKITIDQREEIEQIFTEYVGPIADIIFAEELHDATSIEAMIKGLMSHIDDNVDKKAFNDRVIACLSGG